MYIPYHCTSCRQHSTAKVSTLVSRQCPVVLRCVAFLGTKVSNLSHQNTLDRKTAERHSVKVLTVTGNLVWVKFVGDRIVAKCLF